MDCNEVKDILDAHIIGVLNKEQSGKIEKHIKGCSECKEEFTNTMQSLKKMDMLPMVVPSISYADKILYQQRKRRRIMIWTAIIVVTLLISILWMIFPLFSYYEEYPRYHIANLERGIWHYYAKNKKFPESLQKVDDEYFSSDIFKRDQNNNILDIWGTPYQYKSPGIKNSTFFDLHSFGANKQNDNGKIDDIKNWK